MYAALFDMHNGSFSIVHVKTWVVIEVGHTYESAVARMKEMG